MAQFQPCLAFTIEREGGFSNASSDPGGATKFGITRATLSRWIKRPASVADVQNLTETVAGQIYHDWYWLTIDGDALPDGVSVMVFDHGVNCGEHTAAVQLQEVIGIKI